MKNGMIRFKGELPLHLMLLPSVVLLLVFSYVPMGGIIIAFQKFNPARGLFGANPWIGLDNFKYIFSIPTIWTVFANTLYIAIAKIIIGTLVAIIVALLLNECRNKLFKHSVQTIVYFPYFISWIILAGILRDVLSPTNGIVNEIITMMGHNPIFFLGDNQYFRDTLIFTHVWQTFGYTSVIYLAAITGIDPTLYEAATIDGAGRWKQTLHITMPGMSTIIILIIILNLGNLLNAGFEQVFNLYSAGVYQSGDIIDTMVYRLGLEQAKFSPSAAVGILKSGVSLILIVTSYYIAYKKFDYKVF